MLHHLFIRFDRCHLPFFRRKGETCPIFCILLFWHSKKLKTYQEFYMRLRLSSHALDVASSERLIKWSSLRRAKWLSHWEWLLINGTISKNFTNVKSRMLWACAKSVLQGGPNLNAVFLGEQDSSLRFISKIVCTFLFSFEPLHNSHLRISKFLKHCFVNHLSSMSFLSRPETVWSSKPFSTQNTGISRLCNAFLAII